MNAIQVVWISLDLPGSLYIQPGESYVIDVRSARTGEGSG
jgi:hypothetical protein